MVAVYDTLVDDVTKEELISYVTDIVDEFQNVSLLVIDGVYPYDPQGQLMPHGILQICVISANIC